MVSNEEILLGVEFKSDLESDYSIKVLFIFARSWHVLERATRARPVFLDIRFGIRVVFH